MIVNILSPIRRGGPYHWSKNTVFMLNENGINAKCINTIGSILLSPIYQNADLIHTTVPLAYKFWNKPVVLTIKGEYTIEKNVWRYLYPIAINKADVITTPSNFLKEKLDLDDAVVIPNAVFTDRFGVVNHTEKKTLTFVTVTNFSFKDKSEGILRIIKAIENIQRSVTKDIEYLIVGGGKYLHEIIEQTKCSTLRIKFTGYLENPEQILRTSDIFVYFSTHDNFPNVILEAMASGLPVVTNYVGAVNEIITNGHDGYVAECESDYEDYILNLMNDCRLRKRIGQNARISVEEKFDWNNIIYEYISLYNKLIE